MKDAEATDISFEIARATILDLSIKTTDLRVKAACAYIAVNSEDSDERQHAAELLVSISAP